MALPEAGALAPLPVRFPERPVEAVAACEGVLTWFSLVQAHANLARHIDLALEARHLISLPEHTVLFHLADAGGRMRMSDLAGAALLSPSGASRLVDRLVAARLVERVRCPSDGRSVYAVLTDSGRERLDGARETYEGQIQEHLADRFREPELRRLADLLRRLAPPCEVRGPVS
ncbi:MAG: MarR family winged helix-turn-helix transcriptional regulator [Candidatus Dormibacteraeota bacterium]|nr:MarR family winged helix-turn-helix transcriptional regulator [Candidatus Dormibacteraeota bacterium]